MALYISYLCGKHCVNCVCTHIEFARDIFILTHDAHVTCNLILVDVTILSILCCPCSFILMVGKQNHIYCTVYIHVYVLVHTVEPRLTDTPQ